jgi:hypothetical protein
MEHAAPFVLMVHMLKIHRPLLFVIIADGLSIVVFLLFFAALPGLVLIPCTYPLAQSLAFALCAALLIHLFVFNRFWLVRARSLMVAYFLCLLLVLWLGSYPFSPLGFSSGRVPVLGGFMLTRSGRPPISVASRQVVTIAAASISQITPMTLPVDMTCTWLSTNGGALDDPRSCDVAYFSPGASAYDTLKLLIQPGCRLPNAEGEIKISILP